MAMSSGASSPSGSGGLRYAPFAVDGYPHDYNNYLDTERFDATTSNCDAKTVFDARNGLDCNTALGIWVHRWTQ